MWYGRFSARNRSKSTEWGSNKNLRVEKETKKILNCTNLSLTIECYCKSDLQKKQKETRGSMIPLNNLTDKSGLSCYYLVAILNP